MPALKMKSNIGSYIPALYRTNLQLAYVWQIDNTPPVLMITTGLPQ
jgi:hypothetical protein